MKPSGTDRALARGRGRPRDQDRPDARPATETGAPGAGPTPETDAQDAQPTTGTDTTGAYPTGETEAQPARRACETSARGGWRAGEVGLGAVFAGLLAFWGFRVAVSWGGGFWLFGCVAGATVCGLALARRRGQAWAAVAALTVAAAAILASWLADLPAEPGPAMALALSVLVGSAVGTLPGLPACAIAAGGLAVATGSLLTAHPSTSSLPPVTALNVGAWLGGVTIGLCSRLSAARRRAMAETVRRHERLQLARELHDVVAHHVTGIVLQAQAAQVLARRQPGRLGGSLAGIETAGSDALVATRRLVGLLRTAAPPTRPRETPIHRHGRHGLLTRHGGYGLLGMRERLEALGGTLSAGPRPETAGWSVLATLPLTTHPLGAGPRPETADWSVPPTLPLATRPPGAGRVTGAGDPAGPVTRRPARDVDDPSVERP